MEHFTRCDEIITTYTIKKQFIVFQMKINNFNENIYQKHDHRMKTKLSEWVDIDS